MSLPEELYVQGTKVSNGELDVEITLDWEVDSKHSRDTVNFSVVDADRVEITTIDGGGLQSNDYPDPAAALGLKWYPDAYEPGGGWNEQVRVKAFVTPAVANVPVYFALFDPDDPSADDNEVDNDGEVGGDDFLGTDNRGGGGGIAPT